MRPGEVPWIPELEGGKDRRSQKSFRKTWALKMQQVVIEECHFQHNGPSVFCTV